MTDTSELERLRALNAEMLAALRRCAAYIDSPLRMSNDEDEHARRNAIVELASAAIAKAAPLPQEEK